MYNLGGLQRVTLYQKASNWTSGQDSAIWHRWMWTEKPTPVTWGHFCTLCQIFISCIFNGQGTWSQREVKRRVLTQLLVSCKSVGLCLFFRYQCVWGTWHVRIVMGRLSMAGSLSDGSRGLSLPPRGELLPGRVMRSKAHFLNWLLSCTSAMNIITETFVQHIV